MARLDSMGVAKEIAQIGAAIGREFTGPLLQQVCDQEPSVLGAALVRLQNAAVVYRRGEGVDATYVFKHALLQDAAYDSLLRSRRTELHRTIAEILGAQRPDQPGAEPELVAQHYARAGLLAEAVGWWGQGIERALRRSAYPEALGHFRNVLPVIETLGESNIDLALLSEAAGQLRPGADRRARVRRPRDLGGVRSGQPAGRRASKTRWNAIRSSTAYGPAITSAATCLPWPKRRNPSSTTRPRSRISRISVWRTGRTASRAGISAIT